MLVDAAPADLTAVSAIPVTISAFTLEKIPYQNIVRM
jgi:hypothetical protein